jgi:hypothetical protein
MTETSVDFGNFNIKLDYDVFGQLSVFIQDQRRQASVPSHVNIHVADDTVELPVEIVHLHESAA